MTNTGPDRTRRWRERKRKGLVSIMIDVSLAQRKAFESLGLVPAGQAKNLGALVWAAERFLETAPSVAGIGAALYPSVENFTDEGESGE